MNRTEQISTKELVLYDASCLSGVSAALFVPHAANEQVIRLGRGTVYLFEYQGLKVVSRHYCRGGMVRYLVKDSYWYSSLDATRMWREFHLLQALRSKGLPVPLPLAVRCVKTSLFSYRGDIVTEVIPNAQTLAQHLQQQNLPSERWQALGGLIARFHRAGVYHADLNANNIMLDDNGEFHFIDFDRGELREPLVGNGWALKNLMRLRRSLTKLTARHSVFHFPDSAWTSLNTAYSAG